MISRRAILQSSGAAFAQVWLAPFIHAQITPRSVTETWADAIVKARYEDLSPEVIQRAKLCLLDNIGVLAHTSTLPELRSFLNRQFSVGGPREATVWGYNRKLPLETAAACNAFLIHGNEIDDSDFRSNYRASCVSLPAPLSVAEFTRATGRDLLLATAIAYTINGRLAAQVDRLQGLGFMPSSVVGGGGTAAATAKLMKLDAQHTMWAMGLGIAGGGGLFQYYFDQTEEKKLHVARAARLGVESAQLAAQGYEGPPHIVEGASGLLPSYLRGTGRKPDYDAMKRGIEQWEGPLYIYPKFTSTSSSIGPFLDALAPVYQREKLKPADIEKFIVSHYWEMKTPFVDKILHFEAPPTIVGAQMNMNYSVALFLLRGSASVYDFTKEALRDQAVLALAARAGYEQVAENTESAIKVVLRDGRTISAPFKYSRGAQPEPLRMDLREQKFAALTRDRLTDAGRKQVRDMVEQLDTVKDVAAWTAALHKLFKPLALLLFAALWLSNAMNAYAQNADTTSEIESGGMKRTFVLHAPANADKTKPLPLLIALHGGGGQGSRINGLTGFNKLADQQNVYVVYPDGVARNWNDGRESVRRKDVDDVRFIRDLIEHLAKTYRIDRQRVYAAGISNGGMMSLRLACDLSDHIAAVASVAANLPSALVNNCKPARPVPVMLLAGTHDPLMPFKGGEISTLGGLGMGGKVESAETTATFWAKLNRTATKPVITELPDVDANDGTRVRREVYGKGAQGSEVVFYTITNGGHTWPGGFQYLGEAIIGKTSRDLKASETMLEFFLRHKR